MSTKDLDRRLNVMRESVASGLLSTDETIAILGFTAKSRWAAQRRIGWSLWRRVKDRWL